MSANPDVRFRDSALREKSAKFTWLCYFVGSEASTRNYEEAVFYFP